MAALSSIVAATLIGSAVLSTAKTLTQKAPKMPDPPALPPIPKPERSSAAITAALQRQRARSTGKSGRAGTLLTGPSGITTTSQSQPKTLLGS